MFFCFLEKQQILVAQKTITIQDFVVKPVDTVKSQTGKWHFSKHESISTDDHDLWFILWPSLPPLRLPRRPPGWSSHRESVSFLKPCPFSLLPGDRSDPWRGQTLPGDSPAPEDVHGSSITFWANQPASQPASQSTNQPTSHPAHRTLATHSHPHQPHPHPACIFPLSPFVSSFLLFSFPASFALIYHRRGGWEGGGGNTSVQPQRHEIHIHRTPSYQSWYDHQHTVSGWRAPPWIRLKKAKAKKKKACEIAGHEVWILNSHPRQSCHIHWAVITVEQVLSVNTSTAVYLSLPPTSSVSPQTYPLFCRLTSPASKSFTVPPSDLSYPSD